MNLQEAMNYAKENEEEIEKGSFKLLALAGPELNGGEQIMFHELTYYVEEEDEVDDWWNIYMEGGSIGQNSSGVEESIGFETLEEFQSEYPEYTYIMKLNFQVYDSSVNPFGSNGWVGLEQIFKDKVGKWPDACYPPSTEEKALMNTFISKAYKEINNLNSI